MISTSFCKENHIVQGYTQIIIRNKSYPSEVAENQHGLGYYSQYAHLLST